MILFYQRTLISRFRDFPKSVMVMLRNSTFMFITLAGITGHLIVSGFAAFLPKILESLFMLTHSFSSILVGEL